jgi:hypothetical protein
MVQPASMIAPGPPASARTITDARWLYVLDIGRRDRARVS